MNRDKLRDRAATRAVIGGTASRIDGDVNWLGHQLGSGNARMDELLLAGATPQELAACRPSYRQQLMHLEKDHGLAVIPVGGGRLAFELGAHTSSRARPVASVESPGTSKATNASALPPGPNVYSNVQFRWLSADEDVVARGTVRVGPGEMVLDIQDHGVAGPYLLKARCHGHVFTARNVARGGEAEISAKWADLDGDFVGLWVKDGNDFLFTFRLPGR